MGFSRKEYWSWLPHPSPGDLPNPGIEPVFLTSPALAGGFFTTSATWEALFMATVSINSRLLQRESGFIHMTKKTVFKIFMSTADVGSEYLQVL